MVTRRRILQAAAALPVASHVPGFAAASAALTAAPVAGHLTHDSVRLWLQASTSTVATLIFWPEPGRESDARKLDIQLLDKNACSAIAEIRGLAADARYRFTLQLDGQSTGLMRSFRTAPLPGAAPSAFRIYLGSCAYTEAMSPNGNPYGDEFHIFDTIAGKMQADSLPHLMLWLGDNLYFRPKGKFLGEADYSGVARMEARYREVREKDMFQKLFAATHHYAIWDDHDYGPNDSDASYAFKGETLKLFRRYWPNPESGLPDVPGTFGVARYGDVHFFLLDDRYHRSPNVSPDGPGKTMFGARQIEWLKQRLAAAPRSSIKVVAGGSQFWNRATRFEGWHHFRTERDAFAAWLARERIEGVVFLSGDRHFGELLKVERAGAYPLYEFTSSPLTSRPPARIDKADRANPDVVPGTLVVKRQFGLIRVSGPGDERRVAFEARDSEGELLWRHEIAASELRFARTARAADPGLIQLDPFAQATHGMAGCPASSPPLVTPEQMRIVAHERAERGTYCALEGRCEPGGAYRRDPEVNERVASAIAQDKRFGNSSVAVTTTRRFVTLTGCVRTDAQRRALVALVGSQPGVDRVFDETRVGAPVASGAGKATR